MNYTNMIYRELIQDLLNEVEELKYYLTAAQTDLNIMNDADELSHDAFISIDSRLSEIKASIHCLENDVNREIEEEE